MVITASMHARLCQFLEVQKPPDLDLNLGSGQGNVSMHSTCNTTSTPNHLNAASRSTEISPFECREISTVCKV